MAKYLDTTGVSTLWSKVKEYSTSKANAAVKTVTDTKGKASGIASLDSNGYVPLSQLGNLDTTFAEVVTALPTSNIKKHLYLVKSSTTSQNLYSEYIYTGDTTATYDASKWEKLGEYKADIDLSDYAKKSQVVGSLEWQYSDNNDRIYIIPRLVDGDTYRPVEVPPVTNERPGVMSPDDKADLDRVVSFVDDYNPPFTYFNKGTSDVKESTDNNNTYILQGGLDYKVYKNKITGTGATTVSSDGTNLIINSTDTHYTSKNVVSDTSTGTTDKAKMNGVYLNHIENGNVTSSHLLTGNGVDCMVQSDERGNITINTVNTHVKSAAVVQNSNDVKITLSLNNSTSITATIPAVDSGVGAGVLTTEMAELLSDTTLKVQGIADKATADSAITASELAAILV